MNPVHRALQKVLRIQTAHPVAVVLIALALTALSVIYTARNLKFETSQMALISPQNRLVKLSEEIDSFDDLDTFVVVIESTDPARSREFLQALAPRLMEDHENYLQVFYRVDPETLKNWQLLYMDKKDLSTLRDNLREHREFIQNLVRSPSLTRFFTEVNREMTTSMVGELFTGFLDEDTTAGKKLRSLCFHLLT